MNDIEHLKRLDRFRDRDLGIAATEVDIPVTADMIEAGISAALSAELYQGDCPFSEAVILRIYLAMERRRISDRSAGQA